MVVHAGSCLQLVLVEVDDDGFVFYLLPFQNYLGHIETIEG